MSIATTPAGNVRWSPADWPTRPFSSLVREFRYGTSEKSSETGLPALRIPNVIGGGLNLEDLTCVPVPAAEEARLRLINGDLLFVRTNGNPDYVGRCATFFEETVSATGFPADRFIYASYLIRARLKTDEVDPAFIREFMLSPAGRAQLKKKSKTSAGQYNINIEGLSGIQVPVPSSLDEQRAIVAVVERIKALRRSRLSSIALLRELSRSIFLDMFGDPVENLRGWDKKPLTEVCHPYSGGTPSKGEPEFWNGQVPWFSPKDLKADDLFDAQDHISETALSRTTLKLLPENTVAIVVRGMILAHTFPVSVLRVPATVNQDLKALLPKVDIEPQFLAACLRSQSSYALSQVSTSAHGTCRIDSGGLGKIGVLLPPIELQRTFAKRIAKLEAQQAAHATHLAELDELLATLQYQIFDGEL